MWSSCSRWCQALSVSQHAPLLLHTGIIRTKPVRHTPAALSALAPRLGIRIFTWASCAHEISLGNQVLQDGSRAEGCGPRGRMGSCIRGDGTSDKRNCTTLTSLRLCLLRSVTLVLLVWRFAVAPAEPTRFVPLCSLPRQVVTCLVPVFLIHRPSKYRR